MPTKEISQPEMRVPEAIFRESDAYSPYPLNLKPISTSILESEALN